MKILQKFVSVFVLLAVFVFGCFYYLQHEFGIQIPKVNLVTGDTCGIVIYNNTVLNFSSWDPHKIKGYLTPDVIPEMYFVGKVYGGSYIQSDGSTVFGYSVIDGGCKVNTSEVVLTDSSLSYIREIHYRMPFVLP